MQFRIAHDLRSHSSFCLRPSALTLVELLIVMVILSLLVSSAIPVISPPGDERRIREASRGVNTYISGAQARAIETARPVGIALKKLSQETGSIEDNGVCLELYYVEQPVPYVGLSENSRVQLRQPPNVNALQQVQFITRTTNPGAANLPSGWGPDLFPPGLFRPGDIVLVASIPYELVAGNGGNLELDDSGYFTAERVGNAMPTIAISPVDPSNGEFTFEYWANNAQGHLVRVADTPPDQGNIPFWTGPLEYQILRKPVATSTPPYQLPEGTAIDLRASGFGGEVFYQADVLEGEAAVDGKDNYASGYEQAISNPTPVIVMFSPEGTVSQVTFNRGQPPNDGEDSSVDNGGADNDDNLDTQTVSTNLFLLVGLRENIPADPSINFGTFSGTPTELQAEKAKINWLNGSSRWVMIGSQTGNVVTVENASFDPDLAVRAAYTDLGTSDPLVRPLRYNLEISLAREFAAQMSRVGGR